MKTNKAFFFAHYWVEQRHDYLKSLSEREARRLLLTFDDEEINKNVNDRVHQEAYICEFLEDVWEISPRSFWEHVRIAFTHPHGMVISDMNNHIEVMKQYRMPSVVFTQLLSSIPAAMNGYFVDDHLDVLFAQLIEFGSKRREREYREWWSTQPKNIRDVVQGFVQRNIMREKRFASFLQ